jgi:hypothetical protein
MTWVIGWPLGSIVVKEAKFFPWASAFARASIIVVSSSSGDQNHEHSNRTHNLFPNPMLDAPVATVQHPPDSGRDPHTALRHGHLAITAHLVG